MAKIVAVQDGLNNIAQELENAGYQVIGVGEMDYALDAIVYSSQMNVNSKNLNNNELGGAYNDGYCLMLNADEYSVKEIVNKINEL